MLDPQLTRTLHRDWHEHGLYRTSWRGWPMLKYPTDLVTYAEIIHETKPEVVVEAGTFAGVFSLWLADHLDLNGLQSRPRVYTFDPVVRERPADHRILYVEASSTDPEAVTAVREAIDGRRAMVVLDSSHEPGHVLDELEAWAGVVSPGCYLVVEDTETDIVLPQWGDGPSAAVTQFIGEAWQTRYGRYFSIDRSRERYGITCAPGGWLRRNHRP